MKRWSFRTRLTVINALVVLLVLGFGGALLGFTTSTMSQNSLDRDLQSRVDRFLHRPPPGGGPLMQGDPAGPPPGANNDDPERPRVMRPDGKGLNGDTPSPALDLDACLRLKQQDVVFSTVSREGKRFRVLTTEFIQPGGDRAVIQIGHDMADLDRLNSAQTHILLSMLPVALLVSVATGWYLAGRALGPVDAVTQAAAGMEATALDKRLQVQGDDELARMASTFNAMLERLELTFGQKEKALQELSLALERQKRFVGDASHELRTPLARLKLVTSAALAQGASPDEMREALTVADNAADSVNHLVQQLLALARADDEAFSKGAGPTSLMDVAKKAMEEQGFSVEVRGSSDALVHARTEDLVRAVGNLLENAARYAAKDLIWIEVGLDAGFGTLSVVDKGPGIPDTHLPHVTERFYRVDAARTRKDGGCGLGLAITHSIAEGFGGTFEIESGEGQGVKATLRLPLESKYS